MKPKRICPYCGWEKHKTKNGWFCLKCRLRVRGDKAE